MKRLSWLVCVALFAACNCDGEDNSGVPADTGIPDMTQPDGGGDDVGDAGGVEPDAAEDDMGMLPDGVSIGGLTAPVTVRFDDRAVFHAECQTSGDCFAAQGYYHAAHRFIQMDVQRRFASGRLAGLIGNAALPIDVEMRTIMSTRDGQPLEEALWEGSSQDVRDGITAYTRGVNAFLDDYRAGRNDARLSEEYELELLDAEQIADWTELDSISSGLLLLESLSNSSGSDLSRGAAYPELTAEQAYDILGPMSATQVATMPASGETYDRVQALLQWPDAADMMPAIDRARSRSALIAEAYEKLAAIDRVFGRNSADKGSNNWVIGPDLTTSGMPILANDPHLGLQNPALWYLAELNASGGEEELHIAGASLPGMPGVLLGHNENVSWGGTVVFFDLADVYLEDLNDDGSAVMFQGGEEAIIEIEHEFQVARSNPVMRTLRFVPHHGPVLAYDAAAGEAISLRWTGNDARTDLDMFFGLFTASNIDEARTAIANSTSTNQNWVVADTNGDIGWYPFNAVPERPWASLALPPWLPLPGDGSAEWGDPIPVDDLPQMTNPSAGFIATANTDPLGTSFDGDPTNEPYGYLYSYGEIGGLRQDAVVKRILDAGDMHTPEISMDMQGDTYLVLRDWVRPGVQNVVTANAGALSADAQAFWDAIAGWDGTCPTGLQGRAPDSDKSVDAAETAASIGCSAFHYLLFSLTEATFADELNGVPAGHDSLEAVRSLVVLLNDPSRLQGGGTYWDNVLTDGPPETRDDIVLRAIEMASSRIRDTMGADMDDWRWGREHTVLFFANVFNNAGFVQYNHGPFAAPGGYMAINVGNPRDPSEEDWGFSHGPSMRHVSEFTADGIVSYWTIPGGQRHFRDSPYFDHLLDDWLAVEHFVMPFQPADVEAAAMETIEVIPRD